MRILLIDDHPSFRERLKQLLHTLDEAVELDSASDYAVALDILRGANYELVLLALKLPVVNGLDELAKLRGTAPDTPVAVLSSEDDARIVHAAIEHGAMSFIPKHPDAEVLAGAMRPLLAQGVYLPPAALEAVEHLRKVLPEAAGETLTGLTPRQRIVLGSLVKGRKSATLARELDVPEATVKADTRAVLEALGARDRTQAVYAVAKLGLRIA